MPLRFLITGATGFIGSHLAQACVQRGYEVATIVRVPPHPSPRESGENFLQGLPAIIHRGELDPPTVNRALEDVDIVVHCAAKVGEGAPISAYRDANVAGLQTLLSACKGQAIGRFIHMSCCTVYPVRHYYGADETQPLGTHRDGYWQSKVQAEQATLASYRDFGVPVVVLRPGVVYGPRDRRLLPTLIDQLRHGRLHYIGDRRRALDAIFVRNLIDAVFLAADNPTAVGRTYNLNDGEFISKQRFIEAIAKALDLPPPRSSRPLWLARLRNNAADIRFLGMNADFSIARAREELGYRPRFNFDDAIAETMAWYKQSPVSYWRKSTSGAG